MVISVNRSCECLPLKTYPFRTESLFSLFLFGSVIYLLMSCVGGCDYPSFPVADAFVIQGRKKEWGVLVTSSTDVSTTTQMIYINALYEE